MNFGKWKRKMSWEVNHPARQLCIWCSLPDGSLATFGFLRLDTCFRRCKICKKSHDKKKSKTMLKLEALPLSEVKGLTFEMCQSGKLTPEVEKAFLQGQIWCRKKSEHTRKPWRITPKKVCVFWGGSGKERKITRRKTAGIKDLEAKGVSATRQECVIYCGAKTYWDQKHLSFSGDYRRLRQPQHSVFQNQGPKTPRNRQFE